MSAHPAIPRGRPLRGYTAPAPADCRSLNLWGWGERQAAQLDFYFNCLAVFSSLLACCQEPEKHWKARAVCPLPGPTDGHHRSIFPARRLWGNSQEQSSELGTLRSSGGAEVHSFLQVLPVTTSISVQEALGEEVTAARPHVPLHSGAHFQPLCSQAGCLFSLKRSFSLGTAVIAVCGSGGMAESARGDAHPMGRRDLHQLLHPGAPSLALAPHPAGAESAGVVNSTGDRSRCQHSRSCHSQVPGVCPEGCTR